MSTSTPIACNLAAIPDSDRGRYFSLRSQVLTAALGVVEIAHGFALLVDAARVPLSALGEWIGFERLCCPFLAFRVSVDGDGPIRLELSGGEGVKDFLRAELPDLGGAKLVQPASLVRKAPAAPRALAIRAATAGDAAAIVRIVREIVDDGTSLAFARDTTDEELRAYFLSPSAATFVACEDGQVVGCYVLIPNQQGRGAHVANASYVVASSGGGRGIGRAMGEHSLREAAARGYRSLQFNYVVSTNTAAIALWTKLGFAIVGRSPRSFDHPRLGLVDTLVMHQALDDG
jgi:L-amino acid N-acyltransferase YncA